MIIHIINFLMKLGSWRGDPSFYYDDHFQSSDHCIFIYDHLSHQILVGWWSACKNATFKQSLNASKDIVWMRQKTEFECVKNLCGFFPDSSHMIINLVAYFAWVLKKLSQLKRYFMTIQVCLSTGGRKAESSSGTGRGKKVVPKMSRH